MEFSTSEALQDWIAKNATYTRCGMFLHGNETFIDTPTLHLVFFGNSDYERWKKDYESGCWFPQLSLF